MDGALNYPHECKRTYVANTTMLHQVVFNKNSLKRAIQLNI